MLFLLICILAIAALTIVVAFSLNQLRQTYSGKAEGVVYRAEKSSDVFYRYTDHLNTRHEGRSQLILNSNPFPTGMRVTVRYDPKDASKFYVEEERKVQTKVYTIFIVCLLVLLFLLAVIYGWTLISKSNKEVIYNESENVSSYGDVPQLRE